MTQPLIQKNIVVIGGTGAGKSSFLNNLALVLRFGTLEEAENYAQNFVPLIPVKMKFNQVLIDEGQDDNERSDDGSSRTLKPLKYRITYGNVVFNFIDTPGMSDSKGQQLDEEHVKHITNCFGQLNAIDGILLFLKATDNTLNDSAKYTFNMLLSCIGKAAGNMISFAITHAGSNKNAGAAPTVIRRYLQDLKNSSEIDFSHNNLYCFESNPLYHVLSTKKAVASASRDRQVYRWSFENNVEELHRLFTKVVNRNDSYNARDIQTMIFARHMHPSLASLVPFIDRQDKEFKYEVGLLEKRILAKDAELYEKRSNLMIVRRWRQPYKLEKIRYVDYTKNVIKERIVKEEYMEEVVIERDDALLALFLVPMILFLRGTMQETRVVNGQVVTKVPKIRDKVEQYVEKETVRVPETYYVTEYREREAYEEDPDVRRSIIRIEDERTRLKNELSSKYSLYERFKLEKEMVLRLLCDVTLHLKEHAMVPTGHSEHLGTSTELSSWIEELKSKGHWKPSDSSPTLQEPRTRLRAMENYEHFGNEIKKIITKYEEFAHFQYRAVDIPIEENNPFIKMVLERVHSKNAVIRCTEA